MHHTTFQERVVSPRARKHSTVAAKRRAAQEGNMFQNQDFKLVPIPIYKDNYVWVMHFPNTKLAVVVDPGSAPEVVEYLEKEGLSLWSVLITHSHWDHVTGLPELKSNPEIWSNEVRVIGPASIEHVTHPAEEGQTIELFANATTEHSGHYGVDVLHTPGHMPEHLSYIVNSQPQILFCGDTLFSAGCGRIFIGSHTELQQSINRLCALPGDTIVCCTHEYTLANIAFAQAVEPENAHLQAHKERVLKLRQQNKPSLPTTIKTEKDINPFVRHGELSVRQAVEQRTNAASPLATPLKNSEVFKELRLWKDSF